MKASPAIVVLSGHFEDVSIGGKSATCVGTLSRSQFDATFAASGYAVGAVEPKYAVQVRLATVGPNHVRPDEIRRLRVRLVPAARDYDRGSLLLEETLRAVGRRDLGRLRKLCLWFPIVLRMAEVRRLLDGLPRNRAEQIAGMRPGHGRPLNPNELFGRVATMTALARDRSITIAKAARILARAVPELNVTPRALENLHAELGQLVDCLDGYALPRVIATSPSWGARSEDELPVYVRTPTR